MREGMSPREPPPMRAVDLAQLAQGNARMNGIIYLVGLVVVIVAILSFFGLR